MRNRCKLNPCCGDQINCSAPAPTVSGEARKEIMRLMREDFDPTPPAWEGRDWNDNAEDVADKIIAVALSEKPTHISDAWRIVKRWLDAYAEEEATFSRYRDDVILDGVMTARERRALSAVLAAVPAPTVSGEAEGSALAWAVDRWNAEVKNRPLQNVHRAALDTTWRQVIRYFGGDPDALLPLPPHYDMTSKPGTGEPDPFPTRAEVLEEAAKEMDKLAVWAQRTANQIVEEWTGSEIPPEDRAANRKDAEEHRVMSRTYRSSAGVLRALTGEKP